MNRVSCTRVEVQLSPKECRSKQKPCILKSSKLNSISLAEKPITSLSQEKGEAATGDETNLHSSCQMKPLNLQPSVEMHQKNRESHRHLYKQ